MYPFPPPHEPSREVSPEVVGVVEGADETWLAEAEDDAACTEEDAAFELVAAEEDVAMELVEAEELTTWVPHLPKPA